MVEGVIMSDQDNLNSDEQRRLSVYEVTEAAKEKLYKIVRIIGAYVFVLLSIIAWFAITNINDAIKKVVGTPDNPTVLVRAQIESRVQVQIDSQIKKIVPEIKRDIIAKIESTMGEIAKDSIEENVRIVENTIKQSLFKRGEELIRQPEAKTIEDLVVDLKHDDWRIRKKAVVAIANMGKTVAIPILKEKLKEEKDQEVLDKIENILATYKNNQ
jgi:HEAT repeat protein